MRKLLLLLSTASIALLAAASPASAGGDTFKCVGPAPGPTGIFIGTFENVVVPPSATCKMAVSTVTGDITVESGASLTFSGGEVGRSILGRAAQKIWVLGGAQVDRAQMRRTREIWLGGSTLGTIDVLGSDDYVRVCQDTVRRDVRVRRSSGFILLGIGHPDFTGCDVNTVGGDMKVEENTPTDLEVDGNSVRNMEVSDNAGFSNVVANQGHELHCEGNTVAFTGGPNYFAQTEGQCF